MCIPDCIQNYYTNNLPDNISNATLMSAAVSTVIGFVVTSDPTTAFVCGALAATASLVDSAITPLIKHFFPNTNDMGFFVSAFKTMIVVVIVGAAATALTGVAIDLGTSMGLILMTKVAFAALNNEWTYPLDRSSLFLYV